MSIVLVHGAWGGAWSWRDAARLLRAKGYDVYAPTLSGQAERAHLPPDLISLSTHVAETAALLRFEDLKNVLLVGHSYGGMVITGAADQARERVAGLVYVDAFLPESGQSVWDIAPDRAADQKKIAAEFDGGHSVPRGPTPTSAPDKAAEWGAMFTPQPIRTMQEPYVSVRGASTADPADWPPRHYLLCAAYKDSPFQKIAARLRGAPDWGYGEFDAMHDVVRTHPVQVADTIAAIAERWGIPRL